MAIENILFINTNEKVLGSLKAKVGLRTISELPIVLSPFAVATIVLLGVY